MHFSVTDLPVPEPPMITRLSPRITRRFTPSSTRLSPKALLHVAQLDPRRRRLRGHQKNSSVST